MNDSAGVEPDGYAGPRAGPSPDRFFVAVAVVMLVVNFIGFAPSFFLKPLFDTPPLPLWTHVHGALFTSWFVLFAVQAVLVQRREIRSHRRLGRVGALLAVLMVLSGSAIVFPRITGAVPNEVLFVLGGMLLLLAAVWGHDLVSRGRLHVVTGFGCPFILGMIVLAAVVIPGTTGFQDLIVWLNRPGL